MSEFRLNNFNVHKMVLTAILLAAKFQDDFYYDNKAFEFAGGVNAAHLHQLELEIFEKLDYNLYVSEEDYEELEMKLYEVYSNEDENWFQFRFFLFLKRQYNFHRKLSESSSKEDSCYNSLLLHLSFIYFLKVILFSLIGE